MGEIESLREQVEEAKERLVGSNGHTPPGTEELENQLTSITAGLQKKQAEIDQLSKENQQLRSMLGEILSAVEAQDTQGAGDILDRFLQETTQLVALDGQEEAEDERNPENSEAAAGEAETESQSDDGDDADVEAEAAEDGQSDAADEEQADTSETQQTAGSEKDVPNETAKQDQPAGDSPALRRIMKRGRRGR